MEVCCIIEERASLGESPVWSAAENAVYWVDIRGQKIHRTDPESGNTNAWDMPSCPGMIALRKSGGLVVALQDGLYGFDPDSGKIDLLVALEADLPDNRANDGKCDAAGRLWVGTMNHATDGAEPTGSFYRIDPDLTVSKIQSDICIPNGLTWNPDSTLMMTTDSRSGVANIHDFDLAAGTRSNNRQFFTFNRAVTGSVDGAAMDTEGGYWAALYKGGKLVRVMADGTIDQEIPLPVSQPTMPAFGGADMKTIFITSASQRLSDESLAAQPLAGGLFTVTIDVPGCPVGMFGG